MTTLEQAVQDALENLANHPKWESIVRTQRQAIEKRAQASFETYVHEFTNLPHPGDFGIPKGHWQQAKDYADQLCASTPVRKWVGLKEDQIETIFKEIERSDFFDCVVPFARAIEAKLHELNT